MNRNIWYNVCLQNDSQLGSVKTVNCGLQALRNSWTVAVKIKSWKPTHCPCNLCQLYFRGIGYKITVNFRCISQFSSANLYIYFFPGVTYFLTCFIYWIKVKIIIITIIIMIIMIITIIIIIIVPETRKYWVYVQGG